MTDIQTDEQIVQMVQSGDTQAFGILVDRYEAKMKRYALKFLAGYSDLEDSVQEVFIKAYVNIQGFDANRKFSSWLYRIAHNQFIDTIKKRGREPLPFFDPDTIFPHPIAADNPIKEVADQQTAEMLNACLDKLNPRYRETLVLYYFEDMDYETIAEVMHVPRSTVGIRLRRSKLILKKIYKESNHGEQ